MNYLSIPRIIALLAISALIIFIVHENKRTTTAPIPAPAVVTVQSTKPQKTNIHRHHNIQTIYQATVEEYGSILELLNAFGTLETTKALNDHIMLHNEAYNKSKAFSLFSAQYKNRPYVQYKHLLDKRIDQLHYYTAQLEKKSPTNTVDYTAMKALTTQLEQLSKVIVISEPYWHEKITLENDNIPTPFKLAKTGITTVAGTLLL